MSESDTEFLKRVKNERPIWLKQFNVERYLFTKDERDKLIEMADKSEKRKWGCVTRTSKIEQLKDEIESLELENQQLKAENDA